MHRDHRHQYSAQTQVCTNYRSADDQKVFDELTAIASAQDVGDAATDDELFAALDDMPENVQTAPQKVPENVQACLPKNVQSKSRRGAAKDRKVIERIQKFEIAPGDARLDSLVAHPHPPFSPNSPRPVSPNSTPCVRLPDWEDVTDAVKVFAASLNIMTEQAPPYAFTFNLPSSTITKAKTSKHSFTDYLKRRLDKKLKKIAGAPRPYWFACDVNRQGRLHVHGMLAVSPEQLPAIRKAMVLAWGKWEAPGKHLQLVFKPGDENWCFYALKNQQRVSGLIGKRVFTIKDRAGAEAVYSTVRSVMAGNAVE